jgi:hypothetical protein
MNVMKICFNLMLTEIVSRFSSWRVVREWKEPEKGAISTQKMFHNFSFLTFNAIQFLLLNDVNRENYSITNDDAEVVRASLSLWLSSLCKWCLPPQDVLEKDMIRFNSTFLCVSFVLVAKWWRSFVHETRAMLEISKFYESFFLNNFPYFQIPSSLCFEVENIIFISLHFLFLLLLINVFSGVQMSSNESINSGGSSK